ncbi:MAG: aldo/keto reductase [Roseiarcus sp.]|jgi:D-threo-aldose 1-dehydrogenase
MNVSNRRRLGRTELFLPIVGVGVCPLGDLFEAIPESEASRTLEASWDEGIRYFDAAPWYGLGQGEHRVGRALYRRPRGDYALSTKVGRLLRAPRDRANIRPAPWRGGLRFDHVYDYTYDGVLRSYEDSLQRLGINQVDILYIHDLDRGYFPDETDLLAKLRELENGGFRALEELKAAGEIKAFGAGINEAGMIGRFLDRHPLDVFLVASRYTLLEQTIYPGELLRAAEAGAGVVIGGVFNSGILATGVTDSARYEYGKAPAEVIERVRALETTARRYGVPLAAVALQFPLAFKAVASVLFGPSNPTEVGANVRCLQTPIPSDLWRDLRRSGLLPDDIPLPD